MSSVGLTPAGNPYVQTSAGKKTGAAAGAVVGGVAGYKLVEVAANKLITEKNINKISPKMWDKLLKAIDKHTIKFKYLTTGVKLLSGIAGAALLLPVGLGIGSMIDKTINHNRQVKADNNAE